MSLTSITAHLSNTTRNQSSFFLSQITREELLSMVRNMPTNKSPGIDKMNIKVIKDCLSIVSEPLTDIINLSLSSNIHCVQELYAHLFFRCISFTFKSRFMKFQI